MPRHEWGETLVRYDGTGAMYETTVEHCERHMKAVVSTFGLTKVPNIRKEMEPKKAFVCTVCGSMSRVGAAGYCKRIRIVGAVLKD